MEHMFMGAKAFNQQLNNWNVSTVTNMRRMFKEAKAFENQDLSSWDVSNVPSGYHDDFMKSSGSGNIEPKWK
jgi:surface protein